MRILCIDYGSKRHGLAISDPLGMTAQPYETFERKTTQIDMDRFLKIVQENDVASIVVGLPRNMDGSEAVHYNDVLSFAKELENHVGKHVATWDERLSTAQAERMLISADTSRKKRKKVIDKVAATLILQSYLDAHPGILQNK